MSIWPKISSETVISDFSILAEYVTSYGQIKNLSFTGYFGLEYL